MKKILLILLLLAAGKSWAQEKTYGVDKEGLLEKRGGLGTLVIIPFEDKMYQSDVDGPIGKETGLNPGELVSKFRNSLVESLEIEMKKDWDILVFHESVRFQDNLGLEFVHASLKYRYTLVPEDVIYENDTTLNKKDIKKRQKESGKGGVENGEIVTRSNESEKYMSMIINNDTLLNFMNRNLASDYYLFLNEFDIKYYVSDPDKITSGGLNYRLKIHFTCIDKEGKVLVSGSATSDVSADSKNIYEIIQQGIPVLTKKQAKMIRKFRLRVENQ